MKIVIHMGLRKTGTTSLQNAFHASRNKLRASGVVYPDGGAARENHRLLTVLYKPDDLVMRDVKSLFDGDRARMQRAAADMWDAIKREVETAKPKLLVLSSEYFMTNPRSADFEKLAGLLSKLSGDITPVLYFREPAAHYGSNIQQNVKKGQAIVPFDGSRLQREVSLIEAAFGKPIAACIADRDRLVGGDIVKDFLCRFVAPVVGDLEVPTVLLNETMSAEELAILERFRKHRYPDHVGMMPDLFTLRTILARLQRDEGRAPRTRLKPEVAQAVRRSTLDLLWLRDRYGLVFEGVDYGSIDGAAFDVDPSRTTIEDLFEVDLGRRDSLQAAAMAEALTSWRQVQRMPRFLREVETAGRRLFARRRRSGA